VDHFENIRDDSIFLTDGKIAAFGGPASLARRLNEAAANWTAQGDLDFLNNW
jgi:hypothetical protein